METTANQRYSIMTLERVQRRATKFILNDYTLSYKSRLQQPNLLQLMYVYELNDLKSLNMSTDNFCYQKLHLF